MSSSSCAETIPAVPRPRAGVETAFLAPEVVLFDPETRATHHLNTGASAVWMLVDGGQDLEGIAGELADLFDRPVAEMLGDVTAAVADFADRGLLDGTVPPVDRDASRSDVLARPPDP